MSAEHDWHMRALAHARNLPEGARPFIVHGDSIYAPNVRGAFAGGGHRPVANENAGEPA